MPSKTNVTSEVKTMILEEYGILDVLTAKLLSGCYGSYDYMVQSYGITKERCIQLEKEINETVDFLKGEYGVEVSWNDVWSVLIEAHGPLEEAWGEIVSEG